MVKAGVAVFAPKVAAVVGAYDAGVKVGEAITGVRSGARLEDVTTGNLGISGHKMSTEDRLAGALSAAVELLSNLASPPRAARRNAVGKSATKVATSPDTQVYDLALGLSRHFRYGGRMLDTFADKVGATTFRKLAQGEPHTDVGILGANILKAMHGAKHIHFNLDGMFTSYSPEKIVRFGAEGIVHGNVTNWELYQVLADPNLRKKTTFYSTEAK